MPSNLEETVQAQLKVIFPSYKIINQYYVRHLGQSLYFDFYIPALNVVIECQGEQHYKYVPHFHGTKEEFRLSKQRDGCKRDWAKLNKTHFLAIDFNDLPTSPKELFYRLEHLING
jgi:hypothetical protein